MNKYPAYPEYKPSNIEWLGMVPSHWDVIRIKHLTPVKRGASPRPIDDPKYFDDEGEFAWVRIADVSASNRYLEATTQRLSELGDSLSVKRWPGDLFLSIAGTVGKPIITKIKCCIHDGFVYFPDLKDNKEFLYYIFACGQPYLGLGKMGTQLNLNTDTVGGILIGLPPAEEQQAIVKYLDFKTAQIDTLIAKKQALLDKLAEKRTALISHAVTKGLDASVPMKDSGVAWLGEIPAHWDVISLRYACEFLNWRRIPLSSEERGAMSERAFPYYGASGVIDYVESYIFDERTILIAEDGANLLSRSTPLAFIADGKYWVNNHAHILKPTKGPFEFWADLLCIISYDPWITGSAQPKLSKENLGGIKLPLPPEQEQAAIVEFISKHSNEIDPMANKISRAIHHLQEYRSALITNAVTGKIDVRDFVTPTPAETAHA